MGCACKKKVQKVVEYDRKLAGKDGEVTYESITEISEEEKEENRNNNSLLKKIINPFIGLFKTLLIIALAILTIAIVIVSIFVWIIWNSFARFVLRKESKLNSPFYEYDKIKKRVKEHNLKIREVFFKHRKEEDPDKTIILKQ
jgi:biopolymer transport protein ExbB/TolQ